MRSTGPALILVLASGCKGDPDPVVSASVLDDGDVAVGGPLAVAVPGDLLLENERMRVVLQQPGRSIALNPYGGNILDADVVRRDGSGHDRWGEAGLFLDGAFTMAAEEVRILDDGSGGSAVVRFEGPAARSFYIVPSVGMEHLVGITSPIDPLDVPELDIAVTYTLEPQADHLLVDVELTNRGTQVRPTIPAWLIHGGLAENWYPALGGHDDTQFASGGAMINAAEEVAYGFAPLPYEPEEHGLAYMAGGTILVDGMSLLDMLGWPDTASLVLEPGQTNSFDAAFTVSEDVSGVMSTLRSLARNPGQSVRLTGTVRAEGSEEPVPYAHVVALEPGGDEVYAATVACGDGSWAMKVPVDAVDLVWGRVGWPHAGGGRDPERLAVQVDGTPLELELPPTGGLAVSVEDGSGVALPARVAVVGLDPSPPWHGWEPTDMDPLPPGVSALVDVPASGEVELVIEPGDYQVVVTRGMEYDAVVEDVEVAAGAVASVQATLHRVLDTEGMLSGDFHIHSAVGPDLVLTDEQRVANYAAEGVEVLVASNHAFVVDLSSAVEDLALEPWVAAVPSQEVTTFDYGHFGLFPMEHHPQLSNGGALDWEGMSPTDIFEWAHAQEQPMVVQINHPRAIPTPLEVQNFFTVLDLYFDDEGWVYGPDALDPMGTGLPADAVMFGEGFTAMEVMTWLNVQGLSDWFNLLSAGFRFAATANSDAHTVRVESSGWPRNFVQVGQDEPSLLEVDQLVAAVNSLKTSGSFGPLVTLEAERQDGGDPVGMGEVLSACGDPVVVRARVQAAPWVPVDRLELYTDLGIAADEVLDPPLVAGAEGGQRQEQVVEVVVDLPHDTWIAAVVSGTGGLFPYVPYNETLGSALSMELLRAGEVDDPATAFGFANPVFVDADCDGVISPSHTIYPADYHDWRWEDRLDPY